MDATVNPRPRPRGQRCRVCHHESFAQIELALVSGIPLRVVAARYGLRKSSLYRHRLNHMSAVHRAALLVARKPSEVDLEALERDESEGLLSQIVAQRARLTTFAAECMAKGNVSGAIAAERALTEGLTLSSRLLGQLISRHEVRHAHVTLTADYLRLRTLLIEELRGHPDLAARIAARMRELEADAAQAITDRGQPVTIEHQPMESTR
jgi:hypothetical protein